MICGMDAFHETKTSCQSVIGFVSTYNRSATKYWSKAVVQSEIGQEICLQLKMLMTKALTQFKQMNGSYPDRVVLYRDGIGSG